jgi:hypothetical protein
MNTQNTRKKKCGELPKLRRWGRIEFWHDRHLRRSAIIVECDDPNYPVIAAFSFHTRVEEVACEQRATSLLDRIKAGRVDYRRLARRVPAEFQWDRAFVGNRG